MEVAQRSGVEVKRNCAPVVNALVDATQSPLQQSRETAISIMGLIGRLFYLPEISRSLLTYPVVELRPMMSLEASFNLSFLNGLKRTAC